jgi:hypothetical protein
LVRLLNISCREKLLVYRKSVKCRKKKGDGGQYLELEE